ncbi:thioester dehydrase [Neisseria leonii]|uniref:Thioester dehydrase n=1 Tax=Neisseria leonii TaxID=2995413 RepID=A0A9X4E1K5_9NEIS|nr:thioester dehydrase [Neisseria sp. 51.81]MDD9327861.1 thioester dehydrase [Neisseria sp. 51.81]
MTECNKKLVCPIETVAPLLPHSGRMVLLDRITAYGDDFLEAEAEIRPDHILLEQGVLPCLSGAEIMAQGIAALAGCRAVNAGEPVRLGFLLGSRKLNVFADVLPVGSRLKIEVRASTQDGSGFGVFDCRLLCVSVPPSWTGRLPPDGVVLAAALNVYSPKADSDGLSGGQ